MDRVRRVLGSLVAMVAIGAVNAPVMADMVSHRAAYRLSLAPGANDGGLSAVRGGLVVEWRAECDGWVSLQRLSYAATTEDDEDFSRDTRASLWESRDLKQMRFSIQSFDDGKESSGVEGTATLDGPGSSGAAEFTGPEAMRLALPAGTLFPTEHMRRLIQDALDDRRVASYPVFDGSVTDSATEVSAVIGKAKMIENARRWPVHLAYFNASSSDGTPEFEMAFDLDAEGIIHDVTLDLGEFALLGKLEKLERLPEPQCR